MKKKKHQMKEWDSESNGSICCTMIWRLVVSFNSRLQENFEHVLGVVRDIESEWTVFLASIVEGTY